MKIQIPSFLVLLLPFTLTTTPTSAFLQSPSSNFNTKSLLPPATIVLHAMSTTASSISSKEAYATLTTKWKTITQLQRIKSVLGYDQLVFMPHSDSTSVERGAQLSALAELIHEKTTDPKLLELMQLVDPLDLDDPDDRRLFELEQRALEENSRVPADLVSKLATLSSSGYSAWVKARQNDDFDSFAPILQDCFDVSIQVANAKRPSPDIDTYTQMLDEYEMGMAQTRIDEIFHSIQTALVPLIAKITASSYTPPTDALQGTFPIDAQKAVCEKIVTAIGFDKSLGRIDVSVHPFTTSFSPSDVRITSRYKETEWYQGLAAMIHESGHAIYEQNLKSSALSIDTALSMGTHESQSLFWERHVGLSRPFWKWATPLLCETFTDFQYSPEEMYEAVNALSRSLIRVEADELAYPLHVILRYTIEKDVMDGTLQVKDIPQRWNQDMKSMLRMDVPSNTQGCLQDMHWSALAFGYFPTYLIGSATAAQLSHYCHQDIPDMDEQIERGEFGAIKAWLTNKVHRHGKRYQSLDALLEDQIGEKLNPKYFIDYLTNKYTELYKLE